MSSIRELRGGTKAGFLMGVGLLFFGIYLFLDYPVGSLGEKVGDILVTVGAMFLAVGFSILIAWKSKL